MKRKKRQRLIRRSVSDANFIHTLQMFPLMRMWAEGVEEGMEVDFNGRNMVQMPVEIAEALIRERALVLDEIGGACRGICAAIDGGVRGAIKFYGDK